MKLKAKTVRLLRRIQKAILNKPRQFDMLTYYRTAYPWEGIIPNCGAAACIAGWGVALDKKLNPKQASKFHTSNQRMFNLGIKALAITKGQGNSLFFHEQWPWRFRNQWDRAQDQRRRRARIAFNRINHFIKTGE